MARKRKAGPRTKKFDGKEYKLDWEVTGRDSKTWTDVRKQELRKKGYSVRVEKRQKNYTVGDKKPVRGKIEARRVYKRKKRR